MTILTRTLLFCGFLVAFAGGCKKKSFAYTSIGDYAVFGDNLYVLLDRVEGIDKSTRFDHGSKSTRNRRVFGVARCSLKESGSSSLELIGTQSFTDVSVLYADSPLLCSTNSVVIATGTNTFEIFFWGKRNATKDRKRLEANQTIFTGSRKLLFGCGESPWVLDAALLLPASDSSSAKMMALLCHDWAIGSQRRAAVSDDLRTVVFQDETAIPPAARIVQLASPTHTNQFALPDANFRVCSVHGSLASTKILFTSLNSNGQTVAVVLDGLGKELSRTELAGTPVADAACNKVVALSSTHAMQLSEGEMLPVTVWFPAQGRRLSLSLDTAGVVAALGSGAKR